MTTDYAAILEEQGADGFVEFIVDSGEHDLPPQYANLEEALAHAYTARDAGNDDADLAKFIENAEQAVLNAYQAEALNEQGGLFDFDFNEFLENPMEAIKNFFGQIIETLKEDGLSALFNANANQQQAEAHAKASMTAAERAADSLRDARGDGVEEIRQVDGTGVVKDTVSGAEFDGFVPG